ncbi:MAG: nuclear transport factor 2 family protein [Quinella sp. 3Q1]|nr:nuclear transport factor 2 family protein [Quinella sp. 3Q1]MBR6887860.1 nuclear transport factor 2 family protein [Selenomonadaceae bacterium]
MTDTQAINELIQNYAASICSCDIDKAAEIWQTDERTTFIHPLGTECGWESVKNNFYGKIMHGMFSERKLIIRDTLTEIYDDAAVAIFQWDFFAVKRADGNNIETHGRESQVYRRVAGSWKIIHGHYSNMPITL